MGGWRAEGVGKVGGRGCRRRSGGRGGGMYIKGR